MATRDPAKGLKRYLTRLKHQKLRDGRMTYPEYCDLGVGADCWYKRETINWRVFEWQVWLSLQVYGRHPRAGTFAEPHFAQSLGAPFVVDDTTLLYVGADEGGKWEFLLVWRVGGDFGFRILSEAEVDAISDLFHALLRSFLGIRFDRLPMHGVPFRGPAL